MPTSERIDRYQYCPNVSVNLAILPAFLEVLVDTLVRDRGKECHIGHADLLLLESLLPISLYSCTEVNDQHKAYVGYVRTDAP